MEPEEWSKPYLLLVISSAVAKEKIITPGKWRLKRGDSVWVLIFLKVVDLLGSARSLFIH